jgi:RNA polymerase sigma factor (sigma-70 family)
MSAAFTDYSPVQRPTTAALGHTLLTAEDETDLAKRIEAGRYAVHLLATGEHHGATVEELEWLVADGDIARDTFIQSNLRLALSTARKFRSRGYTEDDVIQDAYHGLVKAVDRFDHAKGFKFSTYAVWWIRESVLSGIRAAGFVKQPEVLWNQIVKVRATKLRLIDETGDIPTVADLAAETGLSERDVNRAINEDRTITSLQSLLSEELTLGEVLPDAEATEALDAVETSIDRVTLCHRVAETLAQLDATDAEIVRARFGLDGNPPRQINDVAERLGVTRQTVRMREQRAMIALRSHGLRSALEPFRETVD